MSEIGTTGFETMSPAMEFVDNYNNWILSKFKPYIGQSLLEIGTGQGNFKKYIESIIQNYVSIDIDIEVIKRAKERDPQGNYIAIDASGDNFIQTISPFELDSVMCVNVLEHIPNHEKAMENMLSVLKPGGHLLLFVPAFNSLYNDLDSLAGHIRRYKKKDILPLIHPVKHEIIFNEYFNPIGGLGWWVNNFITHKNLNNNTVNNQVEIFDKYIVPISKIFNGVSKHFFGQSLITVIKKI
jgi:2-polyprenyl-3-methyl-5-hydroxy-6-metoxy-1,4-benzoquinol methylase